MYVLYNVCRGIKGKRFKDFVNDVIMTKKIVGI